MPFEVIVLTCKKYYSLLRPFAYLFNTYWSSMQRVIVSCFEKPEFELPQNFQMMSIADESWPANKWSDQLIRTLHAVQTPSVVLLLEDYWLDRGVDHRGVSCMNDYILARPEVLRIDLTADRLYAGGMFEVDHYGSYDIVETSPTTPYQMSLQAGLWNRKNLLRVLRPGLSPWEVELHLSNEVPTGLRILGTRQWPVRYANVCNGGSADSLKNLHEITPDHIQFIRSKGWI